MCICLISLHYQRRIMLQTCTQIYIKQHTNNTHSHTHSHIYSQYRYTQENRSWVVGWGLSEFKLVSSTWSVTNQFLLPTACSQSEAELLTVLVWFPLTRSREVCRWSTMPPYIMYLIQNWKPKVSLILVNSGQFNQVTLQPDLNGDYSWLGLKWPTQPQKRTGEKVLLFGGKL